MNNRNYNVSNNLILASLNNDPNLKQQFDNALIETMQSLNQNLNGGPGVGYYNPSLSQDYANGFANSEFWELTSPYNFKIKPGKKPSEAVTAFLRGLTIADCGNAVGACQLAALLKVLGKEKFDIIFNDSTRPLVISQLIDGSVLGNNNFASQFLNTTLMDGSTNIGEIGNRPIQKGEMCQIWGIPYYSVKHPGGFGRLFNVICAGKNEQGEDLFVGFGLQGAVTERELIEEEIACYNADRNSLDMDVIVSSLNPELYDMTLREVKENLSLEEGFKDAIGFMPNMKVTPRYENIQKYQNMSTEQVARQFGMTVANNNAYDTNNASEETPVRKPKPAPRNPVPTNASPDSRSYDDSSEETNVRRPRSVPTPAPSRSSSYPRELEIKPARYDERKHVRERIHDLGHRLFHHQHNEDHERRCLGERIHDLGHRIFHRR